MCFIVMKDKKFNDTAPAANPAQNREGGRNALVLLFFSCSPISLDNPVSTDPGGYSCRSQFPCNTEESREGKGEQPAGAWLRKGRREPDVCSKEPQGGGNDAH